MCRFILHTLFSSQTVEGCHFILADLCYGSTFFTEGMAYNQAVKRQEGLVVLRDLLGRVVSGQFCDGLYRPIDHRKNNVRHSIGTDCRLRRR